MLLIYRLILKFYQWAISLASLFNVKAKLMLDGRKQTLQQLQTHKSAENTAWFHCASVGEFEQARPLIESFKEKFPNYEVVVTFFSPSAYELRKNYQLADYIYYLPFDSPKNASLFIEKLNPNVVFFVKYEFWYFYLSELAKRDTWVFSVSTIFRSNQPFFKWYGGFYRKILMNFDHIFVQNQTSAGLLKTINLYHFSVAGDTRYDRVKTISEQAASFPILDQFCHQQNILIAGSTWPADIDALADLIHADLSLKYVIVPHEITEKQISHIEKSLNVNSVRYSKFDENELDAKVLIIDNMGMLAALYKYGKYAYIGGAFGAGLHNILEASVYGLPVFFGNKNYKKFDEANQLIKIQGAKSIKDGKSLLAEIRILESDDLLYQKKREEITQFVNNNLGACAEIMNHCERLIRQ